MSIIDSAKGTLGGITRVASSVSSLLDPRNARMAISGLFPGGANSQAKRPTSIGFKSGTGSLINPEDDWRVRISLSPANKIFYNDVSNDLLKPLVNTNGVIFPYTPQINVTHQAVYNSASLTHSNYAAHFYQGSEVNDIQITGEFTVQTVEEGQYLLAAIYFLRSATKMFFGFDQNTGEGAGNPPPLVYLDGYGEHYFPHVQCAITQFSHTMPNEVDYIEIPITTTKVIEVDTPPPAPNSGVQLSPEDAQYVPEHLKSLNPTRKQTAFSTSTKTTRLPTVSSITVVLKPIYSRKNLHDKFTLQDFAAGRLVKGNGGFI